MSEETLIFEQSYRTRTRMPKEGLVRGDDGRAFCCARLGSISPSGFELSRLAYRDLRRGFSNLPDDQRAVLLLISVEDFSYEEAARILRVPIGTVMSRLSRGRERLRQHMNGDQSPPLEPKWQRSSPRHLRPAISHA